MAPHTTRARCCKEPAVNHRQIGAHLRAHRPSMRRRSPPHSGSRRRRQPSTREALSACNSSDRACSPSAAPTAQQRSTSPSEKQHNTCSSRQLATHAAPRCLPRAPADLPAPPPAMQRGRGGLALGRPTDAQPADSLAGFIYSLPHQNERALAGRCVQSCPRSLSPAACRRSPPPPPTLPPPPTTTTYLVPPRSHPHKQPRRALHMGAH